MLGAYTLIHQEIETTHPRPSEVSRKGNSLRQSSPCRSTCRSLSGVRRRRGGGTDVALLHSPRRSGSRRWAALTDGCADSSRETSL